MKNNSKVVSLAIDGILPQKISNSTILSNREDLEHDDQLTQYNEGAFTKHIYEVHGNINLMRCSRPGTHARYLYPIPPESDENAADEPILCAECQDPMRPCFKLPDDYYTQLYLRKD